MEMLLKTILNSTASAWVMAVGWSLFTIFMMLSPGSQSTASDLSAAFGGSEWTDYLGHIALTMIETALLANLLSRYLRLGRALMAALPVLVATSGLEFLQRWVPDRGSSVFDAVANAVGIAFGVALFLWFERRRAERPQAE